MTDKYIDLDQTEYEEDTAEDAGEEITVDSPMLEEIPEDLPLEKLSDSAFYRMYLREVKSRTVPDEARQTELYRKLAAGDTSVMETIVDGWLLRIVEMAKPYKAYPVQMEDLIQEGNMALWVALSGMNGTVDSSETDSYLEGKVREAFENYVREITGDSDRANAVLGKAALLLEARELLRQENRIEPSLRELSDYTHIPAEEIQDILALYKEEQ